MQTPEGQAHTQRMQTLITTTNAGFGRRPSRPSGLFRQPGKGKEKAVEKGEPDWTEGVSDESFLAAYELFETDQARQRATASLTRAADQSRQSGKGYLRRDVAEIRTFADAKQAARKGRATEEEEEAVPDVSGGLVSDLSSMQLDTDRSPRTPANIIADERAIDQSLRDCHREARGWKRSPALLVAGRQAARSVKPSILRSSAPSRQLPDSEKQRGGEAVLHKRRKLHREPSSEEDSEGEGSGLDASDSDGEEWESAGSGGTSSDSDGSDSEGVVDTSQFDLDEFEEPDATRKPAIFKATDGLWEPVRLECDEVYASPSGRHKHRQDKPCLQPSAEGVVCEARRQAHFVDAAAPRGDIRRHELQALAKGKSNTPSRRGAKLGYKRAVQGGIAKSRHA